MKLKYFLYRILLLSGYFSGQIDEISNLTNILKFITLVRKLDLSLELRRVQMFLVEQQRHYFFVCLFLTEDSRMKMLYDGTTVDRRIKRTLTSGTLMTIIK